MSPAEAVRNAHAWFEVNSGWAQPDEDTLADWLADGVSRAPDHCLVVPAGWCRHGLASWHLILAAERGLPDDDRSEDGADDLDDDHHQADHEAR